MGLTVCHPTLYMAYTGLHEHLLTRVYDSGEESKRRVCEGTAGHRSTGLLSHAVWAAPREYAPAVPGP